ncbi:calcium homeostasis modulator protein 3 [Platysternon megacephalum]|uniref:Calcium homeostasis modulator protein 3 n=1 Tax=Platysternon megacephalum TaxID=55544 RepID=A0A4D9ECM1_9SAUR|nr:calcium homeostasis modulator protein 3 [Platysternon megacephalum]
MVFQKMMRIRGWLIGRGRSSLIVALLWAALGIGCDMLEIIYPSTILSLKEGDRLTLNCTVWHEQKQSSDLKVYWCKQVENQSSCARVGKELERLSLNPQARVSLSLLLQIHNVSRSDSGGYQCRASANNQTAIGHHIRVKVTADSTVSAVVGTRAVLRCPNTSVSSLILVIWKIRPKSGSHCSLAYRADANRTDRTNCNERMTWESSPDHDPALQIHPVRLADEVPPVVTLTLDSNGIIVCQAFAGKPAAEISWAQGNGHSTENKTHHTNGTVTTLSSMPMINSTNAHVTCLVTHPAMNQTQTIELSSKLSADITLSPVLHYFLICTSSCVAVAVVALILYWTLKCRASWLSGLADAATVPKTTGNNLKLTSRPGTVNTTNSSTVERIYQNYSVQNMHQNINSLKTQRQRV